ncbi:MAG: hypothetical protein Q4B63_04475 [Clostridium perfringens]|nr:hypothetical protein [Clostridium perfringens]
MRVLGSGVFDPVDEELEEAILNMEERHEQRVQGNNDKTIIDDILAVMLNSYLNKFDTRRMQIMDHFKVMMMHFKEDVKSAENEKDIKKAIEKYDKSLKRQIRITDNDLNWASLKGDVNEIVREFHETKEMIEYLYDMVMEKNYYFKAKILENRNNVCDHIDEEFKMLLETENGKEYREYIVDAYELCKNELLDDKRFN